MKPLSEISTTRPSCKINFNICIDCGKLFSAKRSQKKRCKICNDPVTKQRKIKGLVRLERNCMNPDCGKPFVTYNKNQFACESKACQNIVANIRRRPKLKMRRSLGLCANCGAETNGKSLCDRCSDKANKNQKDRRSKLKTNGLCRECGKNPVEAGQYRCVECLETMRDRRGPRQCRTDGCDNTPVFGRIFCQECLDLREADRHSCKVYFITCNVCGKLFTAKEKLKLYRGDKCMNAAHYYGQDVKKESRECKECGRLFTTYDKNIQAAYCSPACNKRAVHRNGKHVRRLRERAAFKEVVNKNVVFERDCCRCQICGRKLNLQRQVPHPLAVTIDHIIPLSKGGEHSYRNVQLACFRCNSSKGDRTVNGGEQLRLFG